MQSAKHAKVQVDLALRATPQAKRPVCRKIGYVPVRSKNTSEIGVIRLTPHPRPIVCQRLQRENRIFVAAKALSAEPR